MKNIISQLKAHMCDLFWKIYEEKEAITIDGMPGYNEKAQFVGGKVIKFCCYVVTEYLRGTAEYEKGLQALKEIIQMTSVMPMETWGILYSLEGLYRLKEHGLLEQEVNPSDMENIKAVMDWRTFVDEEHDFELIHKPTNYYGVAFGIARYRELLGWEPLGYSEILLNHLLNHITQYSGSYGFMDETKGDGRFDRYSILIPGEITSLVLDTGWTQPELITRMLDASAHIFLQLANEEGTGISYGRSIGAYGEAAALQVLAPAALLGGIFHEDEEKIAFGYSCRLIRRMVTFWYDEKMQSINMWEKGRRTDQYRNKHRILGENVSLNMQIVDVMEQWEKVGYHWDQEPEDWVDALKKQKQAKLFRFAKDTYDRCLVIIRDGAHVWSLPVISGGKEYYDKDPYLTVPRENLVLEGVPDTSHGALIPLFYTAEDEVLMPAVFSSQVTLREEEGNQVVSIEYPALCVKPKKAPKVSVAAGKASDGAVPVIEQRNGYTLHTEFRFSHGEILRKDVLSVKQGAAKIKRAELTFETFSEEPAIRDNGACVRFEKGPVLALETTGYQRCIAETGVWDSKEHDTPHGGNRCVCHWVSREDVDQETWDLSWKLIYKN